MQDELLLRQWQIGHAQFSVDLDQALAKLGRMLTPRAPASRHIDRAYGDQSRDPALREAANTLLSGLAAVTTSVLLFVAAGLLATPSAI